MKNEKMKNEKLISLHKMNKNIVEQILNVYK